jgi:hypothetical protein
MNYTWHTHDNSARKLLQIGNTNAFQALATKYPSFLQGFQVPITDIPGAGLQTAPVVNPGVVTRCLSPALPTPTVRFIGVNLCTFHVSYQKACAVGADNLDLPAGTKFGSCPKSVMAVEAFECFELRIDGV